MTGIPDPDLSDVAAPPSMVIIVPVVYAETSEARKATITPISSAVPARPMGSGFINSSQRPSSPRPSLARVFMIVIKRSVAIAPGLMPTDRCRDIERAPRPAARITLPAREEPARTDAGFEHAKLELRVKELTEQLGEESRRAAALHYRLAQVAEDRNTLELNLAGERAASQLAQRAIAELRAELERLRAEQALPPARGEVGAWRTRKAQRRWAPGCGR